MTWLLILGLAAVAFGQECGVPRKSDNYIVGGDPAGKLEFPWQISLQRSEKFGWRHICGGVIIDKNWIFTAAHCVDLKFVGFGSLRVVTGEHDMTKLEGTENFFVVDRYAGDIAIHPQWDSDFADYDYALIRLNKPLDFNGAQSHLAPICMPTLEDRDRFDNMNCTGSGWGRTKRDGDGRDVPATLQKITFRVPTHQQCNSAWLRGGIGSPRPLTPRHICAATVQGEGHGVCQGDSGGPLQCFTDDNRWTLAGVSSFGKYCGSNDYPNVYARTTAALDWIETVKRSRTPNSLEGSRVARIVR